METSHWEVQKVLKVVGGYLGALTHSQSLTSLLLSKSFVLSLSLSPVRLCDPMDYSPPGSSVHGISQASILEWVAVSSSRGSSRTRDGNFLLHWQADSFPLSHQGSPSKSLGLP